VVCLAASHPFTLAHGRAIRVAGSRPVVRCVVRFSRHPPTGGYEDSGTSRGPSTTYSNGAASQAPPRETDKREVGSSTLPRPIPTYPLNAQHETRLADPSNSPKTRSSSARTLADGNMMDVAVTSPVAREEQRRSVRRDEQADSRVLATVDSTERMRKSSARQKSVRLDYS
jgi:hypothetical protein